MLNLRSVLRDYPLAWLDNSAKMHDIFVTLSSTQNPKNIDAWNRSSGPIAERCEELALELKFIPIGPQNRYCRQTFGV